MNLSTKEYDWKEWPKDTYYSHENNNSMSVEASGRRVVAVKVYDENGKSEFCTGGGEWWIDRTKPKVTITDHKNYKGNQCIDRPNYTYNHRYEVHMSDEHSGIYSTICEWEQGPTTRSGWRPSVGENLCQTKTGGVNCKACDGVGNCQTASK